MKETQISREKTQRKWIENGIICINLPQNLLLKNNKFRATDEEGSFALTI